MQYTIKGRNPVQGNSRSGTALVASFFHLTHLLQAGVGLSDALDELSALERGYRRNYWHQIARYVKQGRSLSEAMAELPAVFDARLTALIHAGESRGELGAACHGCMRQLQWHLQFRSRMTTVLIYPLFALSVLTAVGLFLMVYMVPAMGGFLVTNPATLSWHARLLLTLSDGLVQYTWLLMSVLMISIVAWVGCRRLYQPFRAWTDCLLLRLPLLGQLMIDLELSSYSRTCAHLYGAGISLTDSMKIAEGVLSSVALKQALKTGREHICAGGSFSTALDGQPILPGLFKRMISAGESGGALEKAMLQASEQLQRQTDDALDRAEKLIGPVMLLLMGAMLIWIVTSLLGPVYQSAIDTVLTS